MTVMMKLITLKLKFCDKVTISSQLIEITKKLTGKNFKRICSLMDVFLDCGVSNFSFVIETS